MWYYRKVRVLLECVVSTLCIIAVQAYSCSKYDRLDIFKKGALTSYEMKPENPFYINWTHHSSSTISMHEYEELYNVTHSMDIKDRLLKFVHEKYQHQPPKSTTEDDFVGRILVGLRQKYYNRVHPDNAKAAFPSSTVLEYGPNNEQCIITSVRTDKPQTAKELGHLINGLSDVNFQGRLIYSQNYFPNPTGVEVHMIAVPYALKIFLLVEAYIKHGCTQIVWADAPMISRRDLTPLFNHITTYGLAFSVHHNVDSNWRLVFPQTLTLLKSLTGINPVEKQIHIPFGTFGLDMSTAQARSYVHQFYRMASLGWPFFSCFPEEFVSTAILLQEEFKPYLQPLKDDVKIFSVKTCSNCFFAHGHLT